MCAYFGHLFLIHQNTFCVNSLAKTLGVKTYPKENTNYDKAISSWDTFAETYYNY